MLYVDTRAAFLLRHAQSYAAARLTQHDVSSVQRATSVPARRYATRLLRSLTIPSSDDELIDVIRLRCHIIFATT